MSLISKIPWKALLIFFVGIVLGLYLGSKGTFTTIIKVFETESVSKAINKPTNTNETKIEFNGNKFKRNDTISVNLQQEPNTSQEIKTITEPCDSIWGKLNKSQTNRLKRWIKE